MSRLTSTAIILKTKLYGERDLIVDLFTETHGRTRVIAKGALNSKKRYMGALEVGHLVKVDYVIKPGLSTLGPCDVLQRQWQIRQNLHALQQMYYTLELCLLATPLEEKDEAFYQSLVELLAALESGPGLPELYIFAWELRLFAHLGYELNIGRCPLTGHSPDGISAQLGGCISSSAGKPYWPVRTEALRVLYRLQHSGDIKDLYLSKQDQEQIRTAFVGCWSYITGSKLQSYSVFEQVDLNLDQCHKQTEVELETITPAIHTSFHSTPSV